ncbi:hypothetical protein D9758_010240 [Tetrapyrgos nigripes]|uniref:Small secreted protein n=1 Tax=Tetrapyrgos nigripes TaxID=182062 RepID=A0A8H5AZ38_9AGAR|nr:hypothetical protein D9758_018539 [Tetrapyrgos nigripes]KAF5349746.1 hypothetical protein D9758_010240 [Tetrapyrgos nigripes]
MARFAFFATALLLSFLASFVSAVPVPSKSEALARRAFKELAYADFQISDGVAGQAQTKANAVFVDPFKNVDILTISQADIQALENMRVAAENAETQLFNPAIDAATGAAKDALQAGKIQNKVLKLIGFNQVLNIQIAQAQAAGQASNVATFQTRLQDGQNKLATNLAIDQQNAGKASKGIA